MEEFLQPGSEKAFKIIKDLSLVLPPDEILDLIIRNPAIVQNASEMKREELQKVIAGYPKEGAAPAKEEAAVRPKEGAPMAVPQKGDLFIRLQKLGVTRFKEAGDFLQKTFNPLTTQQKEPGEETREQQ